MQLVIFVLICFCFFFFKQKTAYEMRISDWSSDVCSSDLEHAMTQKLLSAHHLYKRFGGLTATNDVSLDLNAHEIKCVIGPNGAGKSTFLNLICGTLKPSSGEVIFDGHNIVDTPLHVIARMGIARKFQVPSVFERLSVRDNLEVAQGGTHGARRTEISIPEKIGRAHV